MKSLVLFNNKGGVGKTTLTLHIAHMMARQGLRTVVLDYDPQCNISAALLDEDTLANIWNTEALRPNRGWTVTACIERLRRGKGELRTPRLVEIADNLWLLPGHLSLSRFEQLLATEWSKIMAVDNERALDVVTALDLLSNLAAEQARADIVLVDVGPSLGALNRAALMACDHVIVPLAPDLFSLQGLKNVGPSLREWRKDWLTVAAHFLNGRPQAEMPTHEFTPIGYIVQQHLARTDRPVKGYQEWAIRIPAVYHEFVLGEEADGQQLTLDTDPEKLWLLKHYASLVPLAQQARKPMFDLKTADGLGSAQLKAVATCATEFKQMARLIAVKIGARIRRP